MDIDKAVSQSRLWDRLTELARYGATANGGVKRQALTEADLEARLYLVAWAKERGYQATTDSIGNIFIRRDGADGNLAPVFAGSHLDTQPTGGKYDGAYGVAAAMEVLAALDDVGVRTRRPIEVVSWTGEEGCRFPPGCIGSSVFAGTQPSSSVLATLDPQGIKLVDALRPTLDGMKSVEIRRADHRPYCYVEPHIEQGPLLELEGIPIGVVTGFQGSCRITIEVLGEEGHAGTTPRRTRKDALFSAVDIVTELKNATQDEDDILRFTIGRFDVFPGSPNTVPGRVLFWVDIRHPDNSVLRGKADEVRRVAKKSGGLCTVNVEEPFYRPPSKFRPTVVDVIRESTRALGLRHLDISSGAGHDAMHMDKICPTGMIFIPCLGGLSHNEAESITPEDSAVGARVLARTVLVLAQ